MFESRAGTQSPKGNESSKLLAIATDAKGVAVIEEDLREETRKASEERREKQEKTDGRDQSAQATP